MVEQTCGLIVGGDTIEPYHYDIADIDLSPREGEITYPGIAGALGEIAQALQHLDQFRGRFYDAQSTTGGHSGDFYVWVDPDDGTRHFIKVSRRGQVVTGMKYVATNGKTSGTGEPVRPGTLWTELRVGAVSGSYEVGVVNFVKDSKPGVLVPGYEGSGLGEMRGDSIAQADPSQVLAAIGLLRSVVTRASERYGSLPGPDIPNPVANLIEDLALLSVAPGARGRARIGYDRGFYRPDLARQLELSLSPLFAVEDQPVEPAATFSLSRLVVARSRTGVRSNRRSSLERFEAAYPIGECCISRVRFDRHHLPGPLPAGCRSRHALTYVDIAVYPSGGLPLVNIEVSPSSDTGSVYLAYAPRPVEDEYARPGVRDVVLRAVDSSGIFARWLLESMWA